MASSSPIEDLFFAALEKGTSHEREAFLREACQGDSNLRRRIERLLDAHSKAQSFLEHPPVDVPLPDGDPPPDPYNELTQADVNDLLGAVIADRYKLLEEIAEGGMGTIWVAEQTEPVRRRVALKLIKLGMDSRQVLSRFEAERQALALMDHPNIAKVFDGGMTDRGRPFFVMEYVKGVPITEYCDQARMPFRERLKLFVQVCQAVQHAHQKGIIHRDLKPSNILVCQYDGLPVPKVIDFGLAKAMHQPLTNRTVYTGHGFMVGTPLYMSPEQAELNNLDIDTRTDVYSLGVILYELITGTTPLDRQRFKDAAWQEIVRLIKEEEPSKPSTKLSGSGSLPSIASQRSLEPAQLSRVVRGDLDWIVMKALDKSRARRYETANGLARDLERYLHDEPIEARPPSVGYRFSKFARRHRGPLITGVAMSLVLVAATAVSMWQAYRATGAERASLAALGEVERQRTRAEVGFRNARAAVDRLTTVSESRLLNVPGLQPLRQDLLQSALEYYEQFARDNQHDQELQVELVHAQYRLASIAGSIGSTEDALGQCRRAIETYEAVLRDVPANEECQVMLAKAYHAASAFELDARSEGSPQRALTSIDNAIQIAERLARVRSEDIGCQSNLVPYYRRRAFIAYIASFKQGASMGDISAAKQALEQGARITERLIRQHPGHADVPRWRFELAQQMTSIASLEGRDVEELRELSGQMANLYEELAELDSADYRQAELGETAMRLGWVYSQADDADACRAEWKKALAIFEKLADENSAVTHYQHQLAECHVRFGTTFFLSLSRAQDEAHLRQALEIRQRLVRDNPYFQYDLVRAYIHLGRLQTQQGRYAEAETLLTQAVDTAEELVRDGSHGLRNLALAWARQSLARQRALFAGTQGRKAEAERHWQAALALADAARSTGYARAELLAMLGRWDEAAQAFRQRIDQIDTEPNRRDRICVFEYAMLQLAAGDEAGYRASCAELLRCCDTANQTEAFSLVVACAVGNRAVDDLERVLKIAQDLAASEPANPGYQAILGMLRFRTGQTDEAIAALTRWLPLLVLAEIVAPQQADLIRTGRVAGATVLAMAYREKNDQALLAKQVASLRKLVATAEDTPPTFTSVTARWTLPLTIHLAKRELAQLAAALPDASSANDTEP